MKMKKLTSFRFVKVGDFICFNFSEKWKKYSWRSGAFLVLKVDSYSDAEAVVVFFDRSLCDPLLYFENFISSGHSKDPIFRDNSIFLVEEDS
jgi:hypothetical protein